MVCQFLLYNKVNQLYVNIYPHISSLLRLPPTLPIPPLQVVTKHQADLPVLCGCFLLAIYFTFGSVYMSMLLSHFVPAYPSPSPCPQVHSLRLHLINLFLSLFLAALGLCCCTQAFSSCGEQGLLFVAVRGLLTAVASLVADHRLQAHRPQQLWLAGSRAQAQQLWHTDLVAPRHVGSSRTRA